MVALLYIGGKFLAYSAWIFWGLRALRNESTPSPLGSLALGFLRLCLGLFFGVLIYLLSATLLKAVVFSAEVDRPRRDWGLRTNYRDPRSLSCLLPASRLQ